MNTQVCVVNDLTKDRGSGLFGLVFGFTVFLLFLFAAVQILFNLYANTVVTSAAVRATRVVAGYDSANSRCDSTETAETVFWQSLGNYRDQGSVVLTWICNNSEKISLTVEARHPTILPKRLQGLIELGRLNRTIEMRVEDTR